MKGYINNPHHPNAAPYTAAVTADSVINPSHINFAMCQGSSLTIPRKFLCVRYVNIGLSFSMPHFLNTLLSALNKNVSIKALEQPANVKKM